MKNLTLILLLLSVNVYSQITLDFEATSHRIYFKLNNNETKYYNDSNSTINATNKLLLYNLDGSLYKTIQIPPNPNAILSGIDWISQTLFDNDASNIEYLVFYQKDSASFLQYQAKVIREDGTILLDEINADSYYFIGFGHYVPLIYATEKGPKLMLDYTYAYGQYYQTKVFSLPGVIPNKVEDNYQVPPSSLSIYPNPNNGSFFIKIRGGKSEETVIDLYTLTGSLINTYKSDNNLIHIEKYGLPEGEYFLNKRGLGINSTAKMIIKK